VADIIRLTFANATTHTIEVDAGLGESIAQDLVAHRGAYKGGWIKVTDRKWFNLAAVIALELSLDGDLDGSS
jgi:hypothetical protein